MKKIYIRWLFYLSLLSVWACTENIVIDAPYGKKVPVVEGVITDEYKRHEIVLSYSSELYSHEREMIPNADVYLVGGGDTIYYHEEVNNPGHYVTDPVAGVKNRRYHLNIDVAENTLYSSSIHMIAEVKMSNNARGIDSIGLLPKHDENNIPLVDDSAAVCICPYFQTLSDSSIVYNIELYLNGERFKNRPSKFFQLFPMKGYAGYYFNGPEMLKDNIEIPVGIMNKSYLHEGDVVKVKMFSIPKDYMYYLMNQKLSIGVNPVMGAFPAMFSNIFSDCDAIGWFGAISVIEGEAVYHE